MPGKPRLTEARVASETEKEYVTEIAFENGHKATLRILKDASERYQAADAISGEYIYRNIFGMHNYASEPEEEKAHVREILDAAATRWEAEKG